MADAEGALSGCTKFVDMSASGKILFIGKLIVFISSFGFAFGNLLHDDEYANKHGDHVTPS